MAYRVSGEYSTITAAPIDDSVEGEDRLTSRVAGTPHSELRSGFGGGRRTQAEWEVAMPTVGNHRGGRTVRRLVLALMALTAPGVCPSHAEDCKYFSALPDD